MTALRIDFYGRALARPDFPLRGSLGDEHLHAGDGFDAAPGGELQQLRLSRAINRVKNEAAIQIAGVERRIPDQRDACRRAWRSQSRRKIRVPEMLARDCLAADGFCERHRAFRAPRADADGSSALVRARKPRRARRRRLQRSARGCHAEGCAVREREARPRSPCCSRKACRPLRTTTVFTAPIAAARGSQPSRWRRIVCLCGSVTLNPAMPKRFDRGQKIAQIAHKKRQIDGVHAARLKRGVLHDGESECATGLPMMP